MKSILSAAFALALTGCLTTVSDIRGREVQDDLIVAKSVAEVRDCLVATLATGRAPVIIGNDQRSEIAFSSEQAGMIFHYTLTATANGTRVEARRKNNIANGFNQGRSCYS